MVDDPRLGQVLSGKYRLERFIAAGGLGRVYLATHLALGTPVAVKLLSGQASSDPERRARFRREARALAVLSHPGIVSAYDFGEVDGDPFLVMEYVRGSPLGDHVVRAGQLLPVPRVLGIARQILDVLEAAHAEGIVHRDLKPDNVMLLDAGDRADHVKVLDFGIALMRDREGEERLTATGEVHGTPLYMSPEQCRGREVGPPSDVYSLGVVLYELLSGDPPFSGESHAVLMSQTMFVPPPPIASRGLERPAPPDLEAVVMAALAKREEDRPTAVAMRDRLDAVARGASPQAVATRSAEARIRDLALSRSERALPPVRRDERPAPAPERPVVLLSVAEHARSDALIASLGANGVDAYPWRDTEAPPAAIFGAPVRALILEGGAGAADRTRAARSSASGAKLPLLVIDVPRAADTVALVRAGASDVTLGAVGDDEICRKVWRLIRRGR